MYAGTLDSLLNSLSFTHGDQITEYDEGYIGDVFSDIANSNIDIYTSDLFDWGKSNFDYINYATEEFGDPHDIIKQIQQGQYYKEEQDLYDNQNNVLLYYAYNYLKDNEIQISEEDEEELEDYIKSLDNNDTIDSINEFCNNLSKEKDAL